MRFDERDTMFARMTRIEESSNLTVAVKDTALTLGAVAVGCTLVDAKYIYTHKGRRDEDYGHEIRLDHPSIIVFLVEMDFHEMRQAPRAETIADHFCTICNKCAENCPSRALTVEEREEVHGVMKWPTHVERCYSYWRTVGTDCGICMAVCPYSHKNNRFHNLVRWMVRLGPWTHRPALFFDDLIYGRKWNHDNLPHNEQGGYSEELYDLPNDERAGEDGLRQYHSRSS